MFPDSKTIKLHTKTIFASISEKATKHRMILVHGALLTAELLWGSMTVWGKNALEGGLHPSLFVCFRFFLSAILFAVIAAVAYPKEFFKRPSWGEVKSLTILSFVVGLYTAFFSYGLMLTTATNSVILELTAIVWTALFALILRREKRSWLKLFGIVCGTLGGIIMVEVEKFQFTGQMALGNLLLALVGPVFAIYLLYGEEVFKSMPGPVANVWCNGLGGLFNLIFAMIFFRDEIAPSKIIQLPITAWSSILYSVIVGTVIAYQLYCWALRYASALVASIYFPFQAFSGTLLAFIFLGEQLTFRVLIGGCFVVFGVLSVVYSRKLEEKQMNLLPVQSSEYEELTVATFEEDEEDVGHMLCERNENQLEEVTIMLETEADVADDVSDNDDSTGHTVELQPMGGSNDTGGMITPSSSDSSIAGQVPILKVSESAVIAEVLHKKRYPPMRGLRDSFASDDSSM